jgi:hypothetical protein
VAKWHNPEIRQAKEMCFDGTVTIRFCFSINRGTTNGNLASYEVAGLCKKYFCVPTATEGGDNSAIYVRMAIPVGRKHGALVLIPIWQNGVLHFETPSISVTMDASLLKLRQKLV